MPSGPAPKDLVKRELIEGTGAEANPGDEVSIQYVGVDYETHGVFDSSAWKRGAPYRFKLGSAGITAGWNRGIEGMKLGGRRELIIPPKLGYGSQQVGSVPPNSTLVYVVELVGLR